MKLGTMSFSRTIQYPRNQSYRKIQLRTAKVNLATMGGRAGRLAQLGATAKILLSRFSGGSRFVG